MSNSKRARFMAIVHPPLHGRHDGDFGSVGDGGVRAGVFLVDGDEVAVAPGGEGGVFFR